MNKSFISNLKVAIPPLEIQQQIVERLDAIRKAQELNDKQIALADELFQSLLHRELDPTDKDWEIKGLGDIIQFQYGYTASAKDEGEYRFIRITDISDTGELKANDKKYVGADEAINPYILRTEDLLIARTGATFGKILFFDDEEPSVFASYLIRLSPDTSIVLPRYIWCFSRTQSYWRQARLLMIGSGQPQLNANKVKQIKMPIPPLEIQQQIIQKLQAIQTYKKSLLAQKEKLKELFESTLDKAMAPQTCFAPTGQEGELVR